MTAIPHVIGKDLSYIPSPSLLIDLDALEFNLETIGHFYKNQSCSLRPHIKTHKCVAIAHQQIKKGAKGVTCAKVGEAEVMVHGGIKDVLIANQIVGLHKIERLASLARYANIMVAVDDEKNCQDISEIALKWDVHIDILIEVDVGLNRCGITSNDEALKFVQLIHSLDNIHFKGINAYEGSFRGQSRTERAKKANNSMGRAKSVKSKIESLGFSVDIISAGSTSTWDLTGIYPGVNEMQAGTYVFMETQYLDDHLPFKSALSVLATVISKTDHRIMLDVGKKGITQDQGFPRLADHFNSILQMSEEHCIIENDKGSSQWNVGDRLRLIPSHACTTANLHDHYYCVRNNIAEDILSIDARGRVD